MINRRAAMTGLGASLFVAGCAGSVSGPDATPEQAAAAAYRHPGEPEIILYTMINNRTGSGAHSSMLINAPSQRVIYDPAGSVRFTGVPEIGDVLYGITPQAKEFFESSHARSTYRMLALSRPVDPAVAELALKLVQEKGPAGPALCSNAVSDVLGALPGFESLRGIWTPKKLATNFAKLPNVTRRVRRENDSDDKDAAIAALEAGKKTRTGQP
ncbi:MULTISPECIES: hypothetical protein [unclassified Mameliella]|uniref:hypothetical protein n=1 Tax=unclassified Mameliella TaxID=2630630 RepID=UPI00273D83CC|nr:MULTISPECIES: hypothetical protein [unclassified Mameliella]